MRKFRVPRTSKKPTVKVKVKVEGKVHPITGHKGPEMEYRL
jgi:hypothetical protein